jgi:glycosyltransferase involved in cell wall biosynthesis
MRNPGRRLRICALGAANTVAVQMRSRCLARRGHAVSIVSLEPETLEDLPVLSPPAGRSTMPGRLFSHMAMTRLLRRARAEVLIVHFATLPFNWLLPLVWSGPLVVSVMGGDILFRQRGSVSPARQKATLSLLEIADRIISMSEYMLSEHPRLKAKQLVSPWGIDVERFSGEKASLARRAAELRVRLGVAPRRPLILSPRRIVEVCGISRIVESMTTLSRRGSDAVLLLLKDQPDPDYERRVARLVDEHALGDRIRWLERVRYDDMPVLYRAAAATVSVATSDGVSLSVLESMASGTPVVLGDIPNYAGVFIDRTHCRFVNPLEPSAIAEGILEVLGDQALRETLRKQARDHVRLCGNLDRESERVETMLVDLVQRPRRPLNLTRRLRHAAILPRLLFDRHRQ